MITKFQLEVKSLILLIFVFTSTVIAGDIITELINDPVTMLDFGMFQMEKQLNEDIELNNENGENINVNFNPELNKIQILPNSDDTLT